MNSKIQIWCPHCHKRYSIPTGLGKRKLNCKKCDNSFPTTDALKSAPDEAIKAAVVKTPVVKTPVVKTPVVKTPVAKTPAIPIPVDPSSSSVKPPINPEPYAYEAPPSNFSQSDSALEATQAPPPSTDFHGDVQPPPSPILVPAIISVVLFSLLICGLVVGYFTYLGFSPLADSSLNDTSSPAAREAPPEQIIGAGADPNRSPQDNTAQPTERTAEPAKLKKSAAERMAEAEVERAKQAELSANTKKKQQEDKQRDEEAEQYQAFQKKQQEAAAKKNAFETQQSEAEKLAQEKKARLTAQPDEKPTDNLLMRIRVAGWGVKALAITDRLLVTGEYDVIRIYDWTTKAELFESPRLNEQFGKITALTVSPTLNQLAVGGDNGTIVVFKIDANGQLSEPKDLLNEASNDINQLLFNQTGTRLVSADNKLNINLWDLNKSQLLKQLVTPKPSCKEVALATLGPEGKSFRVANYQSTTDFLFENGKSVKRQKLKSSYPHALEFSPSRKLLAISDGSRIKIRDAADNTLSELKSDNGTHWSLKFIDENTLLAGTRGVVTRWDLKSSQITRRYKIPDASSIKLLAISNDGKQIAVSAASARQDVFVIDVSD